MQCANKCWRIGYDINAQNYCCYNDRYCLVKENGDPGCCLLGSSCGISDCDFETEYLCNVTITITTSSLATTTILTSTSDATGLVTSISRFTTTFLTNSISQTCCERQCSTESFLCDNGSLCCPYGNVCIGSTLCSPTAFNDATTSSFRYTETPNIIPEGCSRTDEQRCPISLGHDFCCLATQTCAIDDDTGNPVCNNPPASGLSIGAKAGIGAGAAVGGGLIVASLTWWYLAHKQRRLERRVRENEFDLDGVMIGGDANDRTTESDNYASGRPAAPAGTRVITSSGGRYQEQHASGRATRWADRLVRGGRRSSRTAMSERSETTGTTDPTRRYQSGTNLYTGPDATVGPFTFQSSNDPTASPIVGAGGQMSHLLLGASIPRPGHVPHGPDDVNRPVELDSHVKGIEQGTHDNKTTLRVTAREIAGPESSGDNGSQEGGSCTDGRDSNMAVITNERHPVTNARVVSLSGPPIELPVLIPGLHSPRMDEQIQSPVVQQGHEKENNENDGGELLPTPTPFMSSDGETPLDLEEPSPFSPGSFSQPSGDTSPFVPNPQHQQQQQ